MTLTFPKGFSRSFVSFILYYYKAFSFDVSRFKANIYTMLTINHDITAGTLSSKTLTFDVTMKVDIKNSQEPFL